MNAVQDQQLFKTNHLTRVLPRLVIYMVAQSLKKYLLITRRSSGPAGLRSLLTFKKPLELYVSLHYTWVCAARNPWLCNLHNTDLSVASMTQSLCNFHAGKHAILVLKAHTSKSGPMDHFNIPKLELMQSFACQTKANSTLIQFTADVTECLLITHCKNVFQHTSRNHLTFVDQVVEILNREEVLRFSLQSPWNPWTIFASSSYSHWLSHAYSLLRLLSLKPLNYLRFVILFTLTQPCLLFASTSISHWLIFAYSLLRHLFHTDSSSLSQCSTLYYINPKYLPCIP